MNLVWRKTEEIGYTYSGPASKATLEIEIASGGSDSETYNQISTIIKNKCDEDSVTLLKTSIYYIGDTLLGKMYNVDFETIGAPSLGTSRLEFVLTPSLALVIAAALVIAISAVIVAYYVHGSLTSISHAAGPTSPLLYGAIAIGILALSAGYIYNKFLSEPKKMYVPEIEYPRRDFGIEGITW